MPKRIYKLTMMYSVSVSAHESCPPCGVKNCGNSFSFYELLLLSYYTPNI